MCAANRGELTEMTPSDVTGMLLDYVADQNLSPQLQVSLRPDQQQRYQTKCRLYRFALVLMFVLEEERGDKQYTRVRDEVEMRTFGQVEKDGDRDAVLAEVRAAMVDLQSLLSPSADRMELSWALKWLEEFDLTVDPIELCTFACKWMDHGIALKKTLDHIQIVQSHSDTA